MKDVMSSASDGWGWVAMLGRSYEPRPHVVLEWVATMATIESI